MGQKVNPIGLRLGVNRTWDSRWFSSKRAYPRLLHEDLKIREKLMKDLRHASVSNIIIERPHKRCQITIYSARPGLIIGKKGTDLDKLRADVRKLVQDDVVLNIVEVRKPETDAMLIALGVAQQLERRVGFRRAMKRAVQGAVRMGAQGIRINCAGRLGGAEIARTEWYREGRVPLHTLRADIDYGTAEAHTTYGICGIKVWVFKGEIMEHDPMARDKKFQQLLDTPRPPRAIDDAEEGAEADAKVDGGADAKADGEKADGATSEGQADEAASDKKAESEPAAKAAKPAAKAAAKPAAKAAKPAAKTTAKAAPKDDAPAPDTDAETK